MCVLCVVLCVLFVCVCSVWVACACACAVCLCMCGVWVYSVRLVSFDTDDRLFVPLCQKAERNSSRGEAWLMVARMNRRVRTTVTLFGGVRGWGAVYTPPPRGRGGVAPGTWVPSLFCVPIYKTRRVIQGLRMCDSIGCPGMTIFIQNKNSQAWGGGWDWIESLPYQFHFIKIIYWFR